MRLPQRNVLAILETLRLRVLLADQRADGMLHCELLYDRQLAFLHLGVYFEEHAFLRLFLMIYYSISFHGFIGRMNGSRLARLLGHCQPIIDLNRFPDFLQDVVYV